MELVRRIRVLALLAVIVVVGAVGFTRPAMLRAGGPPWDPPPCPAGSQDASGGGAAWFSLDPALYGQGTLSGQRLTVGDIAGTVSLRMDLPPESFASGPVAGRVLVGDDDGRRSRLRLVGVAARCAVEIGREASVVRSAILSPDGRLVWEHHVNRVTRADEGVWQRSVGDGVARRVLPGLASDDRFGPTFTTELVLSDDGRLAVGSCGERLCRIRVLDPRTGGLRQVDGTGPIVGISGDRLVAYGPCAGSPCRIDAHDLRTGRRQTLVGEAGSAALGGPGGRTLIHETATGTVASVDLATLARAVVAGAGPGLPVRRGSGATSGADVPAGELLLAPAGRLIDPATARRLVVATGDVRQLVEVLP